MHINLNKYEETLIFFKKKKMIKIKKYKQNKKHVHYNEYDFLFGKEKKCMGLELEIKVPVVRQ